ncbi:MAG TPA: methyltransferase domain-containing protein [bacterium]|nr:methyltransferase domain-containing protein [bacterium]
MFAQLQDINRRPKPFAFYTAADLWTDEYTSSRMLAYHLDGSVNASSRQGEFIERSAAWIVDRFALNESKSVADFGCGPGLYATCLAGSGAAITGIDFSERSLRYARETAARAHLPIDYVHANYLEFATDKRFDLIIMIMCDFCALGPEQRGVLLDKFQALLKPGGRVLLDVYSLSAFAQREETTTYAADLLDGFWSAQPYFGFLNVFKYEAEKVVLDKYTIVEEARTRVVYNWLQYFDRETLAKEFAAHGLTIEAWLGDVAGAAFEETAAEYAVIAKKQ